MHVYFVRHGATRESENHTHQSPNASLSPKGNEQASSVAEYLRSVNPDIILSSEYTRALETARIIGMRVGRVPVTNGLFYEIMRPSKLYGQSVFGIETLWYVVLSVLHHKNPAWRYADAENFCEISRRAERALEYLKNSQGTYASVVVVSHTVFINLMVAYMCKNRLLGMLDLVRTFFHIERMKNGEVIHLEYRGNATTNTCSWYVITENE